MGKKKVIKSFKDLNEWANYLDRKDRNKEAPKMSKKKVSTKTTKRVSQPKQQISMDDFVKMVKSGKHKKFTQPVTVDPKFKEQGTKARTYMKEQAGKYGYTMEKIGGQGNTIMYRFEKANPTTAELEGKE